MNPQYLDAVCSSSDRSRVLTFVLSALRCWN